MPGTTCQAIILAVVYLVAATVRPVMMSANKSRGRKPGSASSDDLRFVGALVRHITASSDDQADAHDRNGSRRSQLSPKRAPRHFAAEPGIANREEQLAAIAGFGTLPTRELRRGFGIGPVLLLSRPV